MLFCCKKNNQCGKCDCVSYADTTCAQFPDTATANNMILGKWYLREVDAPNAPLTGANENSYYCDTSEYVLYFVNGTVMRKGQSANYPAAPDSSKYQLFAYQDSCGSSYFADKFMALDSLGTCVPYLHSQYPPYYVPIKICNNVLIIGGFPELQPPDQPYLYIYSRYLQ